MTEWHLNSRREHDLSDDEKLWIQFLVDQKFGNLSNFVATGMTDIEFDGFSAIASERNLYWDKLASMSRDAIYNYYQREKERISSERDALFPSLSSQAGAEWRIKDLWSLGEALALSFGVAPIVGQIEWAARNRTFDSIAQDFVARFDLIVRGKDASILTDPVAPQAFLAWLASKHINVPREIGDFRVPNEVADWEQAFLKEQRAHKSTRTELEQLKSEIKQFKGKSYRTALKIIGAMALKNFRYDPTRKHNDATTKIHESLSKFEDPPTRRTIFSYVKNGVQLLQSENNANIIVDDENPPF